MTSRPGRLGRDVHAQGAPRDALRIGDIRLRLLGWHDSRACRTRVRNGAVWRTDLSDGLSRHLHCAGAVVLAGAAVCGVSVAIAFLGFFLGPMFPGAVMVTAKLLPKRIHVSAIGFAMALGGTGGTVFPFMIGAVASTAGVQVLQPIVLALIVVVTVVWLSFPKIRKKD